MAQTRGQDALLCGRSLTLLLLQLLACGLTVNGRADFAVLAPSEPVLAVLGKDAELPCHLSLNISAEDMELRCYRDQPSPAVHVHRAGRDGHDKQMAWYRGRTTFLGARLAQGWAAVRIHNVNLADIGRSAAASVTVLRLRRPRCGSGEPIPGPRPREPQTHTKNRKSVRRLFFAQELPEKPGWFDQDPCVLSLERFLAGRYYWEVQVGSQGGLEPGSVSGEPRSEGKASQGPPAWDQALELYRRSSGPLPSQGLSCTRRSPCI
ncbi:hypothetical protein MC885_010536, partial [Smutsia gigantea]